MSRPKRTFAADVGQSSTGTAGPDQIEYDLDNVFAALDPTETFKDGTQGGIGSDNLKNDAVSDEKIGDRTVDDSTSPSSDTGTVSVLLGRIGNRIKAITGEATWKDTPDTSLAAAKAHMDDTGLHAGFASFEGVSNPGGNIDLIAGANIIVAADNVAKAITISATGSVAPAAHAASHGPVGNGGTGDDVITPALLGAATPAEVDAAIATHTGNAAAHHARYTDAEAVAAIKAGDGAGSTLDADLLDGFHASAFAPAGSYALVGHSHGINMYFDATTTTPETITEEQFPGFSPSSSEIYSTANILAGQTRSGSSTTLTAINFTVHKDSSQDAWLEAWARIQKPDGTWLTTPRYRNSSASNQVSLNFTYTPSPFLEYAVGAPVPLELYSEASGNVEGSISVSVTFKNHLVL